jgi:DNA-directed RNA polymerase alpha subunit
MSSIPENLISEAKSNLEQALEKLKNEIDPLDDELNKAAEILASAKKNFTELRLLVNNKKADITRIKGALTSLGIEEETQVEYDDNLGNKLIEELGLNNKAYDTLKRKGINNFEDLKRLSANDLLKINQLGIKTLDVIEKAKSKFSYFNS